MQQPTKILECAIKCSYFLDEYHNIKVQYYYNYYHLQ